MDKHEIGRFYASSFDEKMIEFIVFDNNTMSCPILNIESFQRIILKPRFELFGENVHYTYDAPPTTYFESKLIDNIAKLNKIGKNITKQALKCSWRQVLR